MESYLYQRYTDHAKRIGVRTAETVNRTSLPWASRHLLQSLDGFGVCLWIYEFDFGDESRRVRSTYDPQKRRIVVRKSSVVGMWNACVINGLGPIGYDDVLAIHVAHEIYHHLEYVRPIRTLSYYSLPEFSLIQRYVGWIRGGPPSLELREIAAHAFVMSLLGLSVSPDRIAAMMHTD